MTMSSLHLMYSYRRIPLLLLHEVGFQYSASCFSDTTIYSAANGRGTLMHWIWRHSLHACLQWCRNVLQQRYAPQVTVRLVGTMPEGRVAPYWCRRNLLRTFRKSARFKANREPRIDVAGLERRHKLRSQTLPATYGCSDVSVEVNIKPHYYYSALFITRGRNTLIGIKQNTCTNAINYILEHFFVRLNFIKYWSIFKLISLSESGEHL